MLLVALCFLHTLSFLCSLSFSVFLLCCAYWAIPMHTDEFGLCCGAGLDSSNASRVVDILSALASAGVTVIITIHQPRPDILRLMDRMLLLSGNGQVSTMHSPLPTLFQPHPQSPHLGGLMRPCRRLTFCTGAGAHHSVLSLRITCLFDCSDVCNVCRHECTDSQAQYTQQADRQPSSHAWPGRSVKLLRQTLMHKCWSLVQTFLLACKGCSGSVIRLWESQHERHI